MKTKKIFKRTAALILVFALVSSLICGFTFLFANKNIEKGLDERLFSAAKGSRSVEYIAFTSGGEEKTVYLGKGEGRKSWRNSEEMGEAVKKAFLSAEDREFYNHSGVNIKRTLYAAFNYLVGKIKGEDRGFGASTVTQQVIKNISGDNGYTLKRKLKEIIRAARLEKRHSKDEILEMYLNIVPMSENIYGVGAASEIFFGKEPCQLTLAEAATLAGITNSPARFNPFKYPDECLAKRNRVLYAMKDTGSITEEEYNEARKSPLGVRERLKQERESVCNWFVETAREDIIKDLMREYNLRRGAAALLLSSGTRVYLTENTEIQGILEECFAALESNENREYAMVVTDSVSGKLLGIVGAKGVKKGERITNFALENRAPGSILKPIALYAPLLEDRKINWATLVDDEPVYYIGEGEEAKGYPKNSPDRYDGKITVKDALMQSKNTVAARLYGKLGKERIYNSLLKDYGIDSLVYKRPTESLGYITDLDISPLALGQLTDGVSLRKMTECYSVFLGGEYKKSRSYIAVLDSEGKVILEPKNENKRILSESTANLCDMLLSKVVEEGTARSITLKNTVDTGGKTGTSSLDKDKWFIGFTPYFTAGIWTGTVRGGEGISGGAHLEIWDRAMKKIHSLIKEEAMRGFSSEGLLHLPYPTPKTTEQNDGTVEKEVGTEWGYFTEDNLPDNLYDEYNSEEI